ncbi:MAG: hypothetical protein GF332_01255 [Candidatus Moranbacteria bacterium]|nr:hypothetical protein [Candidatus Moranbacteria bacterium]
MHPILKDLKAKTKQLKNADLGFDVIRIQIKESLQNHILYAIYNNNEYKDLIFYGGMCLRKLFGLNRMSEDLDFETSKKIDLTHLAEQINQYFKKIELDQTYFSIQKNEIISGITMKFPILNLIDLSSHSDEALHVKVEINSKISGVYNTQLSPLMINNLSLILKHYDISTLMAGKINACLTRIYKKGKSNIEIKGRDYYDLIWFMQKGISPNLKKIKDTLKINSIEEVFLLLDKKIAKISSKDLKEDLLPLIPEKNFVIDWCDNFHNFYQRFRQKY